MSKVTDYALKSSPAADDLIMIVDVHDASEGPSGTTKQAALGTLPSGAPVTSVNAKTGPVVLSAADVGADPAGAAAGGAQKSANLGDLASPSAARGNLGLGSAATHAATDFDAAGAAAAVTTSSIGAASAAALSAEVTRATAAEGLAAQQSANLSDLDGIPAARVNLGLTWKDPVQQVTTGALPSNTYASGPQTLTAQVNGALVVDGVTCAQGQRILVSQEGTAQNNGIYVVTLTGSGGAPWVLTRAPDMATGAQITGAVTIVEQGSTQAGSIWFIEGAGPDVLGTTAIFWTRVNALISGVTPQPAPGTGSPGFSGTAADNAHVHPPAGVGATAAVPVTTTAETTIAQITIPANPPAAATYRITAWGTVTEGATAGTIQARTRIGGTLIASITSGSMAISSTGTWRYTAEVQVQSPGATASWPGSLLESLIFTGGNGNGPGAGTATKDSTAAQVFSLTLTLSSSTASASCLGSVCEPRVA